MKKQIKKSKRKIQEKKSFGTKPIDAGNPPMFGYQLYYDPKLKSKMIKFTKDKEMPFEMMQQIMKSCNEVNLKKGEMQVGITIMIPNIIGGKKIKGVFGVKTSGKKKRIIAKKVHKK